MTPELRAADPAGRLGGRNPGPGGGGRHADPAHGRHEEDRAGCDHAGRGHQGDGRMTVNLRALLEEMIEKDASDLHITAGERPKLRIDGDITNASATDVLTPKDTLSLAYSVLTENQKKRFETEDELDFSFGIQNLARFRGNVFKQRGCVAVVIRMIPFNVRTFQDLGLPPVMSKLSEKPRGPDPGDRPDRLGQVDHAGRHARQDQQGAEGPHHHGGRPDRVHPPPPDVHRQPARGGHRHQELRQRAQVRPPRGSGRDPGGRDARPGDHRRLRSPSRRPDTWRWRRCTPTRPPSPSTASSTSSRPTSSSRCAPSSPSCWRA